MPKNKSHNSGKWTAANFNSFIKSGLRKLSMKWGPRNECIKNARIKRGVYRCVGYKRKAHVVTASIKLNGKRVKNVFADHINPVIDPKKGFTSWDDTIKRMFCESEGFQLLCKACHDKKTAEEKKISRGRH